MTAQLRHIDEAPEVPDDEIEIRPNDANAETAVLGALLIAPRELAGVRQAVEPSDFYRPAHEIIYAGILALADRGDPPDPIILADYLAETGDLRRCGGRAYLHELYGGVVTAANATYYAGIIREHADRRRLIDAGNRIIQLGNTPSTDLTKAHSLALSALSIATPRGEAQDSPRLSGMVDGGTFILDAPAQVPALWGEDDRVLWAKGEALMIAGPSGVGKTTLTGQLVRARILGGHVLNLPVEMASKRVLYLAMDRPQQIARALRRTLGDIPREILTERLTVWKGPPLADIAKQPGVLTALANDAGADTVIIDSLKDAALGLKDDDVGAGYNRARQQAIASGIELIELHHLVKNGVDGKEPKNLNGLYGSVWLTAGSGSVILLWGEGGDPIVEFKHLKSPVDEVGPFRVEHDHARGRSSINGQITAVHLASRPGGVTARQAAEAVYDTDKPTPAQLQRTRNQLAKGVTQGRLVRVQGDSSIGIGDVFRAAPIDAALSTESTGLSTTTDPHTTPTSTGYQHPPHDPHTPPTPKQKTAGQDPHANPHNPHTPRP
ncbi:MAG: DnaB-like helicase N-terminal domain-containing protein, partial [Nocardioides sp.]